MTDGYRLAAVALVALLLGHSAPAAGVFTYAPIAGDADSGISAAKTYTHAVDFGAGGPGSWTRDSADPGTSVNGVRFQIGGRTGDNYRLSGVPDFIGYRFFTNGSWTNSSPSGENTVDDLLNDFYFNNNNPAEPADQTLTLTGLMPGTAYLTTFYNAGWEAGVNRIVTVSASDGGSVVFDQNFTGNANPSVLRYAFVAPGDAMTFTFSPANRGWGFHQYAFTNEVVPEPAALAAPGAAALLRGLGRPRRRARR